LGDKKSNTQQYFNNASQIVGKQLWNKIWNKPIVETGLYEMHNACKNHKNS
jgi:hypothetical protein